MGGAEPLTAFGDKSQKITPIGSLAYCKGFKLDSNVENQAYACQVRVRGAACPP